MTPNVHSFIVHGLKSRARQEDRAMNQVIAAFAFFLLLAGQFSAIAAARHVRGGRGSKAISGAPAFLAAVALIALQIGPALAQSDYPSRTVKIVVPVPPGPAADAVPRIVAEKLSARWGKPVIIENRPGAALNLGADAVAKAEPDGYTLLAAPPDPLVVAQHIFAKLGFDPTAFVPVTVLVKFPMLLVAHPRVPATTLSELIAYAKANPDKLTFGTSGKGSLPHLIMEDLMQSAGIRLVHVPYQGLGPAMRDLLAGHIDVMFDSIGNVLPQAKVGKLKLLAATRNQRLAELPEVPAISDTFPTVSHELWIGVVAPPKTSPAIAENLSKAISEVLSQPDVAARLANFSLTPVGGSPTEMAAFMKRDSERMSRIVKAAGLKIE